MEEAIANSEASGGVSTVGSTTAQGLSGSSTTITGTPIVRLAHKSMKDRNRCLRSSKLIRRQSVRMSVRILVTAKPGLIVPVNFSFQ